MKAVSLMILLLLLFFTNSSFGQWTQCNGPNGGEIYNVFEKDGELFAFTDSRIVKSTNNGDNWLKTRFFTEENSGDYLFAINKNIIYFVGSNFGYSKLYLTYDNFATISDIDLGEYKDSVTYLNGFVCLNNILYLASYSGLFKSTDNGQTWKGIPSFSEGVQAMITNGKELFCTVVVKINNKSKSYLIRSKDNAVTWDTLYRDIPFTPKIIQDYNNTYFVASEKLIYKNTGADTNYRKISNIDTNVSDLIINRIVVIDNSVYLCTSNGIYVSNDIGETWQKFAFNGLNVTSIMYSKNRFIVGTSILGIGRKGYGIYISDDNGLTWQSKGLKQNISFLYADDSTIYASGNISGIQKSTNKGVNWDVINRLDYSNIPNDYNILDWEISSFIKKNDTLIAQENIYYYRSTDGGKLWKDIDYRTNNYAIAIASNDSKLFMATYNKLLISEDFGGNFKDWSIKENVDICQVRAYKENVYVLTPTGELYFSQDNGVNWEKHFISVSKDFYGFMFKLVVDSSNIYVLKTEIIIDDVIPTSNTLNFSPDFGKTWSKREISIGHTSDMTADKSNLYFTTYDKGVFKSNDSGVTFQNLGLVGMNASCLLVKDDYLYVGCEENKNSSKSNTGVWKYKIGNGTSIEKNDNFKSSINCSIQVNSNSAKLEYSNLPLGSFELKIYNNLGLLVYSNIINSMQNGEFDFDISSWNSGNYFAVVTDNNSILSAKFLVIQ